MKQECNHEQVRELLEGLERMAELYRSRKTSVRMSGIRKLKQYYRKGGIPEILRHVSSRTSGLDRYIERPVNAAYERWSADPERYFSDQRIAVYTACFGGYDRINAPVIHPDNIDYWLITDTPGMSEGWQEINGTERVPEAYRDDPVLANRWCKMHPQELFPEYDCSVYLDSNILVVSDLTAMTGALTDFPAAMFLHKNRNCVYDEIRACILKGKDKEESLREHEALLKEHGVPEQYGLLEAPIIVRRHNDPRCIRLMDLWWSSFLNGCRRDQVSLIDALYQSGIPVETVGTLGNNVLRCNLVLFMKHAGQI
ncbi:MAG: hypothetical protein IKF51_01165 [Solobacterium sp.]|nr:hypothetical protein [Solobacterium sp.]